MRPVASVCYKYKNFKSAIPDSGAGKRAGVCKKEPDFAHLR